MEELYLTVKEMAELKGCSEQYINILINRDELKSIKLTGQATGQGGIQYRIPLSSIDSKLQIKYKRRQRKLERVSASPPDEPLQVNYEDLTAAERQEIQQWKGIIEEWQAFRGKVSNKAEADASYIDLCNKKFPVLRLNRRTLYRKWSDFNTKGEMALIDRRGKHGKHCKKLSAEMWDVFEYYYLDQSRKGAQLCVTLTKLELEKRGVQFEIPSIDTFLREIKKIPIPYIKWFREGEKAFIGECAPYIKRIYEDLEPDDIWVADNHTFDIMLYDGVKPLRSYLTAFMDVRTRKMMGWCVTDRPCSDATIYALKKGIEKYGIPKALYTDNGREFLFHDFGGSGFRKKRAKDEEFKPGRSGEQDAKRPTSPPTILSKLGIEFWTALPRNARAKGIERAFDTVKENFSKLFEAYTGGTVLVKPDRLKQLVKDSDKLKRVEEFTGFVDTYLAGWYNKQPHTGEGMDGRSPDEAFAELLYEKRTATESQLNLMFMRWSNPMKVGKNGVTLTFYEKKLQYFEQDLWVNYFGKEVYVRYNPDDLSEVRVYDLQERFICSAKLQEELPYNASKEAVAKDMRERRAASKVVKSYKKLKGIQAHDELALILDKAAENLAEGENINPIDLIPIFGNEGYKKAAGDECDEAIDWTSALERLKK